MVDIVQFYSEINTIRFIIEIDLLLKNKWIKLNIKLDVVISLFIWQAHTEYTSQKTYFHNIYYRTDIHNTQYTESCTVNVKSTYNTWTKLVTHKVSFIYL